MVGVGARRPFRKLGKTRSRPAEGYVRFWAYHVRRGDIYRVAEREWKYGAAYDGFPPTVRFANKWTDYTVNVHWDIAVAVPQPVDDISLTH